MSGFDLASIGFLGTCGLRPSVPALGWQAGGAASPGRSLELTVSMVSQLRRHAPMDRMWCQRHRVESHHATITIIVRELSTCRQKRSATYTSIKT